MSAGRRPFLTARWEHLVLLNYVCPPALLTPLVPPGTALDDWQGDTLVSLVGFMFADTRVMGAAIPGHRTFEEVNLRLYVKREVPGEPVRRGVVFIRELVPRQAIAFVARHLYNEPYLAMPMRHHVTLDPETGGVAEYGWESNGAAFRVKAEVSGPARPLVPGSEAQFITEHYWGYTRQPDGSTQEYEVAHPSWLVWDADHAEFSGPAAALYGREFGDVLSRRPRSAFVAAGSEVSVFRGRRL
jgi:uncharacterized protein YqjF (DUF2071 family)